MGGPQKGTPKFREPHTLKPASNLNLRTSKPYLDPQKYVLIFSPKLIITAQKTIILHTFGAQVDPPRLDANLQPAIQKWKLNPQSRSVKLL